MSVSEIYNLNNNQHLCTKILFSKLQSGCQLGSVRISNIMAIFFNYYLQYELRIFPLTHIQFTKFTLAWRISFKIVHLEIYDKLLLIQICCRNKEIYCLHSFENIPLIKKYNFLLVLSPGPNHSNWIELIHYQYELLISMFIISSITFVLHY